MKQKPHDLSQPQTLMQYLRLVLTGFAMGAADIVPGVSGGTMAFILGVYTNLIDAIKSFNVDAIRLLLGLRFNALMDHVSFRFLLALGIGLLSAILSLSSFLSATMDDPNGRILLFAFFFGLVLASILTIGVKVRWSMAAAAMLIAGTVIAFIIVNVVPAEADHSAPFLFVSGMIAITAMILPGISGSFMLLDSGSVRLRADGRQQSGFAAGHYRGLGRCRRHHRLFARAQLLVDSLLQSDGGAACRLHGWVPSGRSTRGRRCLESDLDRHGDDPLPAGAEYRAGYSHRRRLQFALLLLIAGFLLVNLLDHLQVQRESDLQRCYSNKPAASLRVTVICRVSSWRLAYDGGARVPAPR